LPWKPEASLLADRVGSPSLPIGLNCQVADRQARVPLRSWRGRYGRYLVRRGGAADDPTRQEVLHTAFDQAEAHRGWAFPIALPAGTDPVSGGFMENETRGARVLRPAEVAAALQHPPAPPAPVCNLLPAARGPSQRGSNRGRLRSSRMCRERVFQGREALQRFATWPGRTRDRQRAPAAYSHSWVRGVGPNSTISRGISSARGIQRCRLGSDRRQPSTGEGAGQ